MNYYRKKHKIFYDWRNENTFVKRTGKRILLADKFFSDAFRIYSPESIITTCLVKPAVTVISTDLLW